MRSLLCTCAMLITFSCATYKVEDVKGAKRLKIVQAKYKKPQFYIKKYKPSKVKRSLASFEGEIRISNKKAYFLSLWRQYKILQKMTDSHDSISSCPQFHNDILGFKKELKVSSKSKVDLGLSDKFINSSNIHSYPVLSLPYKDTDLYSYLNQTNSWSRADDIAIDAISEYRINLKEEVNTLCEFGNSNEYYIYENLISYYRNNEEFIYSTAALPSVLKVGPVSNLLLINSILTDTSISPFESKLLKKMNVSWFKNYLYEVSLVRNHKIRRFVLKD